MGDSATDQKTKRGPGRPPKGSDSSLQGQDSSGFIERLLQSLNEPRVAIALSKIILPHINQKLSDLVNENETLKNEVALLKNNNEQAPLVAGVTIPTPPKPAAPSTKDTLAAVHHEMSEKRKRAKNIVVLGLSEKSGVPDEDSFSQYMEENLGIKPALHRGKCRRLGKPQAGKVQPLLVAFNSEESARDVLKEGYKLKNKIPRVYLNPDLTPAEALAAFKQREKRRQKKRNDEENVFNNSPLSDPATVNPSRPPSVNDFDFPPLASGGI